MVAVPVATAVARPWLPVVLLMVATAWVSEFQVTEVVMSWVELSENFPVAVNCWVDPTLIVGDWGEIEIETRVADEPTVSVVDPWTVPRLALMDVDPFATAVARPVCRPTVATVLVAEIQLTVVVMFCVLPSL